MTRHPLCWLRLSTPVTYSSKLPGMSERAVYSVTIGLHFFLTGGSEYHPFPA